LTIVPRLTKAAGFELGSGIYINPTIPEANAEFLRGISAHGNGTAAQNAESREQTAPAH
jgi:UDPglucose--hexose-1-phosphate uridylyltransferase